MFKFLELITEVFGWIRIVASPLTIGLGIGAIIYYPHPTLTRLVLGIFVATAGLIIGIIWANNVWKGKGTVWFLSRVMASPELDNPDEENIKTETKKEDRPKAKSFR